MFVQHNFLKVKFSDRIDENGTNIHFHSLMPIVVILLNDVFLFMYLAIWEIRCIFVCNITSVI